MTVTDFLTSSLLLLSLVRVEWRGKKRPCDKKDESLLMCSCPGEQVFVQSLFSGLAHIGCSSHLGFEELMVVSLREPARDSGNEAH